MRILQLRFKNLNSLAGEWKIDFTHPAYTSSGIFAITGPTGSGKTTILDAICLALYGQTPRLKIISRSTNEIMTRDTGECFAEVLFESEKGQFVCHWSQHRSRKKADGELQPPKHEIFELKSQKILENKLARVLNRVIETTGLDFQQFTRSIMLAQGDFAAFLQASADERAPILEKITGTEIYSEISKKVHERNSLEMIKKKDLKERIGGLELLPPDRIAALKEEFRSTEREVLEIKSRQESLRTAVKWLENLARLTSEIEDLKRKMSIVTGKKEKAAVDLARLSRARKTLPFEESFSRLQSDREFAARYEKEIEEKTLRQSELESALAEFLSIHEELRKKLGAIKVDEEKEKGLIIKVRSLDVRIAGISQQVGERKNELEKLQAKILGYRTTLEAAELLQSEKIRLVDSESAYLSEHEGDGHLPGELPVLEMKISQYHKLSQNMGEAKNLVSQKEEELTRLKETFSNQKELLSQKEQALKIATAEYQNIQDDYKRLFDNFEPAAWGTWATTLLKRMMSLERETKIFNTIKKYSERIKGLRVEREALTIDLEEKKAILSDLESRQEVQDQFIARMEADLAHLLRVRSLDEERRYLEDGRPCPLCGSPDHPYTRGLTPVTDQANAKLMTKKEESKNLLDTIRQEKESILKSEADIRLNEETERERVNHIRELLKESGTGFDNIEFVIESGEIKDMFERALEECEVHYSWFREFAELAEILGKKLSQARDAMFAEKENLSSHQVTCQSTEADSDRVVQKISDLKQQMVDQDAQFTTLREEVFNKFGAFGIKLGERDDPGEIISSLMHRKMAFEEALNRKRELDREIGLLSRDIEIGRKQLRDDQGTSDTVGHIVREKEQIYRALSEERSGLYGTKDPDMEEKRLVETVTAAEREFQESSESLKTCEALVESLKDQTKAVKQKLEDLRKNLDHLEKTFGDKIHEAGFSSENDFIKMRMPHDEFESLERTEKELLFEEQDVSLRLEEALRHLEQEKARNVTDKSIPELQEEITKHDTSILEYVLNQGRIEKVLEDQEKLVAKQKDLFQALEQQETECLRWEKLHDLIGSADGKRFRVFAQGLTFDRLIAHANRHLQKMSDRYLLVRKENSSLDLDIIDGYQAGEIRSTKNLSGGESFIVSLALALGLSGMASRNVRIDSLFIDEGFGALDRDTLEVALGTLSTLQQEGKMIGIISHVPALKERILTQITVEKKSGGRSKLVGPGCTSTSIQ